MVVQGLEHHLAPLEEVEEEQEALVEQVLQEWVGLEYRIQLQEHQHTMLAVEEVLLVNQED
jgi:hypothetical protein